MISLVIYLLSLIYADRILTLNLYQWTLCSPGGCKFKTILTKPVTFRGGEAGATSPSTPAHFPSRTYHVIIFQNKVSRTSPVIFICI